jgi:hypothetical protein
MTTVLFLRSVYLPGYTEPIVKTGDKVSGEIRDGWFCIKAKGEEIRINLEWVQIVDNGDMG